MIMEKEVPMVTMTIKEYKNMLDEIEKLKSWKSWYTYTDPLDTRTFYLDSSSVSVAKEMLEKDYKKRLSDEKRKYSEACSLYTSVYEKLKKYEAVEKTWLGKLFFK